MYLLVELARVCAVRLWDLWLSSYLSFTLSVVPVEIQQPDRIMFSAQSYRHLNAALAPAARSRVVQVMCCSVSNLLESPEHLCRVLEGIKVIVESVVVWKCPGVPPFRLLSCV